jgi:hypothetical protein
LIEIIKEILYDHKWQHRIQKKKPMRVLINYFGYPVQTLWSYCSQNFNYFAFQSFNFEPYDFLTYRFPFIEDRTMTSEFSASCLMPSITSNMRALDNQCMLYDVHFSVQYITYIPTFPDPPLLQNYWNECSSMDIRIKGAVN